MRTFFLVIVSLLICLVKNNYSSHPNPINSQSQECKSGEFQCTHSRECIKKSCVCDNIYDCKDSSDEAGCYRGQFI